MSDHFMYRGRSVEILQAVGNPFLMVAIDGEIGDTLYLSVVIAEQEAQAMIDRELEAK